MGRSDPPTTQTAASIRDYAKALRHCAAQFEELANAMEREEMARLEVLHFKSGQEAFQKARSYQKAVEDAFGYELLTRSVSKPALAAEKTVEYRAERKTAEALETLKKAKKPKN